MRWELRIRLMKSYSLLEIQASPPWQRPGWSISVPLWVAGQAIKVSSKTSDRHFSQPHNLPQIKHKKFISSLKGFFIWTLPNKASKPRRRGPGRCSRWASLPPGRPPSYRRCCGVSWGLVVEAGNLLVGSSGTSAISNIRNPPPAIQASHRGVLVLSRGF